MFLIKTVGSPVEHISAFDMQSMPRPWYLDQLSPWKVLGKIN